MKNVFDNLKMGYNYSRNQMYSPTALDTSWSESWNANYQIQFGKDRKLRLPKGIRMRYWLTNFTFNAAGSKAVRTTYSLSKERFLKNPTGVSQGWDNEMQMSYDPFESLRFNFRRGEKRDQLTPRDVYGVPVGKLMLYRQSLDMQYQPRGRVWLISQFNPRLEYMSRYEEDLNPSLRRGDDPEDTRNALNNRTVNIVFDVDVGGYIFAIGKRTGILAAEEKPAVSLQAQRAGFDRRKTEFQDRLQERITPQQPEPGGEAAMLPGLDAAQKPDTTAQRFEPERERPQGAYSDLMLRQPRRTREEDADTVRARAEPADTVAPADKGDPLMVLRHAVRLLGKTKPIRSSIRIDDRLSLIHI